MFAATRRRGARQPFPGGGGQGTVLCRLRRSGVSDGAVNAALAIVAPPPPLLPRKSTVNSPFQGGESTAAFELGILVGENERPELLYGKLRVAGVDQALRRELRPREAILGEPILHVEHAGGLDVAVRAARRPRIFVQQFRPPLGAVSDQRRDDLVLDRRA